MIKLEIFIQKHHKNIFKKNATESFKIINSYKDARYLKRNKKCEETSKYRTFQREQKKNS